MTIIFVIVRFMKNKIVIVIAALTVIVVGFILLKNNPNYINNQPGKSSAPTNKSSSDWPTYTNEEFGFSFSYPPDYVVLGDGKTKPIEGSSGFTIIHHDWRNLHGSVPSLRIDWPTENDVASYPNAVNLENYKDNYTTNYFEVIVHSQEEMVINGISALKQSYSAGELSQRNGEQHFDATSEYARNRAFRYILFDGENTFLILQAWNPATGENASEETKKLASEYERFLDEVAQTFHFLE